MSALTRSISRVALKIRASANPLGNIPTFVSPAQGASPGLAVRLLGYLGFYGYAGGALGDRRGLQITTPSIAAISGVPMVYTDASLQLSAIWCAVERRAKIIASIPLIAYDVPIRGPKSPAVGGRLYGILRESPNSRMTPYQFWTAMMLNHDLRGNAYARIVRAPRQANGLPGEAIAIWPMPADQVKEIVTPDGAMFYTYSLYNEIFVFAEEDVLHLKNLGNGTSGLSKLEFMQASIAESLGQQSAAIKTFSNGGKPTAVLMTDKVLKSEQRAALQARFAEMASGSESRLFVLEADMKYQQLSATAEQIELLSSRQYSIEEFARWFDVPPVLMHHSNVTAWGTGIEQIIEGFHKFTIAPLCVSIEQAVMKRVLTAEQRATMDVAFNLDALLRGTPAARATYQATLVQNGLKTRDEIRAMENDPAMNGNAAMLTVQSNLVPIDLLGKITNPATGGGNGSNLAQ